MKKKRYIFYFIFAFLILISLVRIDENKEITGNSTSYAALIKFASSNALEVKNIMVIAHRGQCSGGPENSLMAIKSSIISKVDYAEIDVQETRDGEVVLMHDRNLRRLTGLDKNVDEVSFNEIEKLNIAPAGAHYIEKIPTLDKVIKQCNGKLKLIIEIKPYANTVDLTSKVVKLIEDNNFVNQCKVHSLSYRILLNVKKLNPNIQTGYIISKPMNNLASLNVNFYSVQENTISKQMVIDIHNKNKKIYAWTVDNTPDMYALLKLNVDGIISDKPKLLLAIKKMNNTKKL